MPRNCSNIPFWGLSLNHCFLDTGAEGAAPGQGYPVSQCQSCEFSSDFLTPWPVLWPASHMLLTSLKQAVCLCVPSALRERNANQTFFSHISQQASFSRSFFILGKTWFFLKINLLRKGYFNLEGEESHFSLIVSYCVTHGRCGHCVNRFLYSADGRVFCQLFPCGLVPGSGLPQFLVREGPLHKPGLDVATPAALLNPPWPQECPVLLTMARMLLQMESEVTVQQDASLSPGQLY